MIIRGVTIEDSVKKTRIEAAWAGQAECKGCGIRDLALFADLKEQDFGLIHLPIDEIWYDSGAVIYNAADEGRAVLTVRSGLVKLVQYLPDGGQRIVRLLRAGDTLGLEVLVGEAYEHTAIVLRRALTCRIPREVVQRLSVETPRLHTQLMKRWHQSVRQADEWLTELSTGSARARVARLLLAQAEATESNVCELFSREDVGAMLGVTTETASRMIAEFRRSGVLTDLESNRYRCDLDELRRIAGEV